VVSLIALGLAVALLVAHLVDERVPRGYVLAAFIASAIVAAGDLKESAGQTCTTATSTSTTTTTDALGMPVTVVQTYTAETCVTRYAVKAEALVALVVSIAMTLLVLVFETLGRLGRVAEWTT
jgi:hypothetical protein